MSIYLVKHNNNIFGIYNDLDLALDYIYSLLNSKLIQKSSNIIIYEYKINSGVILKEYDVNLNYNICNKSIINYHKKDENVFIKTNDVLNIYETDSLAISSYSSDLMSNNLKKEISSIDTEQEEYQKKEKREIMENQIILGQEKINIVHTINLLKEELKKKEEKINQYNYDLELYNKFKTLKNNDSSFIIPFLFEEKYNIFYILESNNKLSFDNFIEKYKPEKIKTPYDEMFNENKVSEIDNSIISEVFSNVDNTDLFLATNQFIEEDIDTLTSSVKTNSSN